MSLFGMICKTKPQKTVELTSGSFSFSLIVRRNPKVRRMRLRIDRRRKMPVLVLNNRMSEKNGLAFALKNGDWIRAQLSKLPETKKFYDGLIFPFFGKNVRIHHSPEAKRGVWIEENIVWVSGHAEHVSRRVFDFIKESLKTRARSQANVFAERLGIKAGKITVRDTKSRWGSCNKNGDVSLSWRLALAPEKVLNYVIAHEISHIKQMNHSEKFWQTVALLTPDYKESEKWLKNNSDFLYSFSA